MHECASSCRGQKRVLDPLEVESQAFKSNPMLTGTRNLAPVFMVEKKVLFTARPYLSSLNMLFKRNFILSYVYVYVLVYVYVPHVCLSQQTLEKGTSPRSLGLGTRTGKATTPPFLVAGSTCTQPVLKT